MLRTDSKYGIGIRTRFFDIKDAKFLESLWRIVFPPSDALFLFSHHGMFSPLLPSFHLPCYFLFPVPLSPFSLRFFPLFPHSPLPSFPFLSPRLSFFLPPTCPFCRGLSFFIFGFWFLHRVGFSSFLLLLDQKAERRRRSKKSSPTSFSKLSAQS